MPVRPPRRPAAALFAAVLTAGLAAGTLTAPASADTLEERLRSAGARLDALEVEVSVAVEDYHEAEIALDASRREAAAGAARVAEAQAALAELQSRLGRFAAAAYRTGGAPDVMTVALTSTSTDFLSKAGLLDQLGRSQADAVTAVMAASSSLAEQQRVADRSATRQAEVTATLAAAKAEIEQDVAESQRLVDTLGAEKERVDRIRAEEAARQAAAARAAEAAQAQRAAAQSAAARAVRAAAAPAARAAAPVARAAAPVAPAAAPEVAPPPASDRAGTAVAWARQQLGKPYKWAGSGPANFDCSGLTSYVWAKAGVGLPHSSRAQYSSAPRVARADLQPGDLVFFGSPIHHVGIYIGGGNMIAAPRSGDVVKIQAIARQDYTGAVRPG